MEPDRAERKLAAILSADVVGYSRLMAEDEAEISPPVLQLVGSRDRESERREAAHLVGTRPTSLPEAGRAASSQDSIAEGSCGR